MGGGVCLLMGALPGGGSKKKSIKGILKGLLIYYTYKLPLIRAVNVGICLFVVVRNVDFYPIRTPDQSECFISKGPYRSP